MEVPMLQHFMTLGRELANNFTVYIPDHRGSGLSGPFGEDYSMQKEFEDIDAIIKKNRCTKFIWTELWCFYPIGMCTRITFNKKNRIIRTPIRC